MVAAITAVRADRLDGGMSMWMVLAIVAGAALAAYGFFVWRHATQRRKEVGGPTKKDQTRLLGFETQHSAARWWVGRVR